MKDQLFQGQLSIRRSPIHGYGVFANQSFSAGDIIEECHALSLEETFNLRDYAFKTGEQSSILLGFGSLYNHAPVPNASYVFYPEHQMMVFTARTAIEMGEEILIYYGDDWFSSRDASVREPSLWFKWRQQKRLWRTLGRFAIILGVLFVISKLLSIA